MLTIIVVPSVVSSNPTKWSNTLKQFFGKRPTNCLSVFDHFVKLALRELMLREILDINYYNTVAKNHQVNAAVFTIFLLLGKLWQTFSVVGIPFSENKMEKGIANGQIFSGKYIPSHVKPNLAWYKREGLLRYIHQLKYNRFIENLKLILILSTSSVEVIH